VIDALARLDQLERTVIVLRHVDELPIAEIADAIGQSVAATDSLLRRGRERLRSRYLETQEGAERSCCGCPGADRCVPDQGASVVIGFRCNVDVLDGLESGQSVSVAR